MRRFQISFRQGIYRLLYDSAGHSWPDGFRACPYGKHPQQYTIYHYSCRKRNAAFFHDKISPSIEEDIAAYFQANKLAIKTENAYLSDYYKTPEQEYGVRCQLREKGRTRLDFTLTVQTKEQAEAICTNWQNQADDVFACLMDLLLK